MHLALAIIRIFAVYKWGDWKHWRQYQSKMLFMLSISMIHEFLTNDFEVWRFNTSVMPGSIVVLLYAVVIMPLSVLLFLSTYPENKSRFKQAIHYFIWIAIYLGVEVIEYISGRITYEHGWDLWDSTLFDVIMFPMLRLHHKNPLIAYSLSVIIIICYMRGFKVPLK